MVREGHKVRVIVSAAAGPSLGAGLPPLYDINPQNGDEYSGLHPNGSGSITILFGTGNPSALVIPCPVARLCRPTCAPTPRLAHPDKSTRVPRRSGCSSGHWASRAAMILTRPDDGTTPPSRAWLDVMR